MNVVQVNFPYLSRKTPSFVLDEAVKVTASGLHLISCVNGKVVDLKDLAELRTHGDYIQVELTDTIRKSLKWAEQAQGEIYCVTCEENQFHEPERVELSDPLSVSGFGQRVMEDMLGL